MPNVLLQNGLEWNMINIEEKEVSTKEKEKWQKWQKGGLNKQRHQRFGEQEEGSIKEIISRRQ